MAQTHARFEDVDTAPAGDVDGVALGSAAGHRCLHDWRSDASRRHSRALQQVLQLDATVRAAVAQDDGAVSLPDPAHGSVAPAQHDQPAAGRRRPDEQGLVRPPGHNDVPNSGHRRDGAAVRRHHAANGARAWVVQSHGMVGKAADLAVLRRVHGGSGVCLVGRQTGPSVPPGVAVVPVATYRAASQRAIWAGAWQGAKRRGSMPVVVVGHVVQSDGGVARREKAVQRRGRGGRRCAGGTRRAKAGCWRP